MFNKLVASQGKKRTASPTTITVSVVAHGLLIAGAVYASVHMPQTVKKAQELVTYMEVKEKPPEPAKPTPPPPPPPEA
ncbi:MAG TPA: hypothetical protein VFL93_16405, partial [Longimicrobiaceae bacterium]|nr:hypothetical protein [Longimicrobiaceae bacterium]